LIEKGFDSFEIYEETIMNDYDDITEREELNMLLFDAEFGHIDAVYVKSLEVISPITLKLLQALLQMQKLDLPVHYENSCILPSDTNIKTFQNQFIDQWQKIRSQSAILNFDDDNKS
jgi:hypothetical protein